MKRRGLLAVLLLAGCNFEQEFATYCVNTGYCRCSAGDCCAEVEQDCAVLGCCDGMICTASGRCEGDVSLHFDPPTVALRTDDVGETDTQHIRLVNVGTRTTFDLLVEAPGVTDIAVDSGNCVILRGGEACDITLVYSPRVYGAQQLELRAIANNNTATATINGQAGIRVFVDYQSSWPGEVFSEPPGILCPSTRCDLYVARGTAVTVRADSATGVAAFAGPPCNSFPCTFRLDSDLSITARFEPFLTLNPGQPAGHVQVNSEFCDFGPCRYAIAGRTTLTPFRSIYQSAALPWTTGPCANQEPACVLDLVAPVVVDVQYADINGAFLVGPMRPIDVGPDGAEADVRCGAGNVAWVFTSRRDPRIVLAASRGWTEPFRHPFLDRLQDAIEGRVWVPMGEGYGPIISGLQPGGALPTAGQVCNDFTSAAGTMVPGSGAMGGIAWYHDAATTLGCGDSGYVLCLARGTPVRLLQSAGPHRTAFVSGPWIPSGGVAAADARCQTEATMAGLSGSFRALIAATGETAMQRFVDPHGPSWVTVTGTDVSPDQGRDFPTAPYVNIASDGKVVLSSGDTVSGTLLWTDVSAGDDPDTCASWTGGAGRTGAARRPETADGPTTRVSCTTAQRLVCLQDQ